MTQPLMCKCGALYEPTAAGRHNHKILHEHEPARAEVDPWSDGTGFGKES
jgi:hypothetical protein